MDDNLEEQLNINQIKESSNNNNNNNNNNKEDAFYRLHKLQLLLKKESALKELCKIIYLLN